MGTSHSRPTHRHRRARSRSAANPGLTSWNSMDEPPVVSNQNHNTNMHSGTGDITNNNPVVNNMFFRDAPNKEDITQIKISAVLQRRHVPGAVYDAQLSSGCMSGTRVQVLGDIESWVKNPGAPQILWLVGMTGTGKSKIAWTVCSEANNNPGVALLGGSFFCSRSADSNSLRDVRCIVPTLAQILARQSKRFSEALAEELERDPDVIHKQVAAQVKQLLYTPLQNLRRSRTPIIFVIDALDACGDRLPANGTSDSAESNRIISEMLEALVAFSRHSLKLPVKFLVTSRPETHIHDTPVPDATFGTALQLYIINKEQDTRLESDPDDCSDV